MFSFSLKKEHFKKHSVLPGFGLTFGFTLFYLALIVLIPLSGLFLQTSTLSWKEFVAAVTAPRVMHAYTITFGCSLIAALINVVFGMLIVWMLVRYRFPGRQLLDALVDIPFALPTAVAGIALTALCTPEGWIGRYAEQMGFQIAFTPLGIILALVFIGLPFVVRTVQPVLEDMEKEVEEAAASLGANRLQTFRHVIIPYLFPALLTGFAMAFARALGEYGSVIFIAGNMPMKSEIIPLLIVIKLEQYDQAGATAIALVMLLVSFLLLWGINHLQKWSQKGIRLA